MNMNKHNALTSNKALFPEQRRCAGVKQEYTGKS